jgi:hypothetical protein
MPNGNGKKQSPGWGDDDDKKKDEAAAAVAPLTDNEISGLRTILERHGFNSKTGTF